MRSAELTPMRRAIGRRMLARKREAPHFYVNDEIGVDAAEARLAEFSTGRRRVSLTAHLLRTCVATLAEHQALNAVWDGEELMLAEEANVGVAIALEDGLVALAVFAGDAANVIEAARCAACLATKETRSCHVD